MPIRYRRYSHAEGLYWLLDYNGSMVVLASGV